MLRVEGLEARYGRAQVLHGISFSVAPGEVLCLLGRNGAGKSTTMKAIMGLVPPSGGTVVFAGRGIAGLPPHEVACVGLGYVPEERRIFTGLTVEENLEVGRRPAPAGQPAWTAERVYALFPVLGEMRRRAGGRMSGGEQQMLAVARTLMGNPRLLLLDEPSEGLSPLVVQRMADAVLTLKQDGMPIVLSEQNLGFAARVADTACVIESGQMRHTGTMAGLLADVEARRRYLSV